MVMIFINTNKSNIISTLKIMSFILIFTVNKKVLFFYIQYQTGLWLLFIFFFDQFILLFTKNHYCFFCFENLIVIIFLNIMGTSKDQINFILFVVFIVVINIKDYIIVFVCHYIYTEKLIKNSFFYFFIKDIYINYIFNFTF